LKGDTGYRNSRCSKEMMTGKDLRDDGIQVLREYKEFRNYR
jgi:hypothetical protein